MGFTLHFINMAEEIKTPKVGVIIIIYNIPSTLFILQIEAIKTFCTDEDYEIQIIDNGNIPLMSEHIKYHAELFGLNYTKTFSTDQNSSTSHSFSADLAYQMFKDRYEIIAYIDHDLIPVKFFSFSEILGDKIMAGLGQHKGIYMWPGLVFWWNSKIDKSLVSFAPQIGLDTGAGLRKIIEEYGIENCRFLNEAYQQNIGFTGTKHGHFSLLHDATFAHMVCASNWSGEDRHEERVNTFINFVKEKAGL